MCMHVAGYNYTCIYMDVLKHLTTLSFNRLAYDLCNKYINIRTYNPSQTRNFSWKQQLYAGPHAGI